MVGLLLRFFHLVRAFKGDLRCWQELVDEAQIQGGDCWILGSKGGEIVRAIRRDGMGNPVPGTCLNRDAEIRAFILGGELYEGIAIWKEARSRDIKIRVVSHRFD